MNLDSLADIIGAAGMQQLTEQGYYIHIGHADLHEELVAATEKTDFTVDPVLLEVENLQYRFTIFDKRWYGIHFMYVHHFPVCDYVEIESFGDRGGFYLLREYLPQDRMSIDALAALLMVLITGGDNQMWSDDVVRELLGHKLLREVEGMPNTYVLFQQSVEELNPLMDLDLLRLMPRVDLSFLLDLSNEALSRIFLAYVNYGRILAREPYISTAARQELLASGIAHLEEGELVFNFRRLNLYHK